MNTSASVEIHRPIDEVFRLTNEHVPEWSNVVVEEEIIDKKEAGVGTTFRSMTQSEGRPMEFRGVVTEYDPPYRSAVHLSGSFFDIDANYTFEKVAKGTVVTQHSTVTPRGVFKIISFLLGWRMKKASCRAIERELQSLKAFCEGASHGVR